MGGRKNVAGITPEEQKLLARVAGFYQHVFTEDRRARGYLEDRGITGKQTIQYFGLGFVNGGLKEILPDDPEVIKSLKRIGVLNKDGKEVFSNCLVVPMFDSSGGVVNLYGRNIDPDNDVQDLFLNESQAGVVNGRAVKRSSSILLTSSVLDALVLYDQGFTNAIPIYGTELTDDVIELLGKGVTEAYLCLSKQKTSPYLASKLKELGIISYPVLLPDKDFATYFKRRPPEEFEQLLKRTNPASLEQSDALDKRKQTLYRLEEYGFTVGFGDRQYQVKGIQRSTTQLKATVKVSVDVSTSKPFELTTIDLYSSRSRHWFTKLCSGLFVEPEALIREDISRLLSLVEEWRPSSENTQGVELTRADRELGLSFLENPDLLDELQQDFNTLGIVGEETNTLVGYLAATSRKLDSPLSVLIQSRSAAGKSTVQDAILSLIPDEEYRKYTRVTDQALFYKDENALLNKILAIEEAEGMGGAAYSIRTIQTAKKITVAATGKDQSGRMRTEEYTVKGPVCVMVTTTATEIDQETASRFIFLTIDESREMTEAIHRRQREAETLDGLIRKKKSEVVFRKHHAAQKMLKPLAVVNPFAEYLKYPSSSLRARRDHQKYLGLIRAVTFLNQYQRETKTVEVDGNVVEYIEASLGDIQNANRLSRMVLGQSMDELARPSRTLLALIFELVKKEADKTGVGLGEIVFTRRMIREYLGWSDWQIRTHIKQLIALEYVNSRTGSWGKEYSYGLYAHSDPVDNSCLDLTTPAEIERAIDSEGRT